MSNRLHRRNFLKTATAASAGMSIGVWSSRAPAASKSPNEKLNIAAVGTNGMAASDLKELSGENIVALCDVDENSLEKAVARYAKATKHIDFRRMLEKEEKSFDAVLVSAPDHIHAPASVMAMSMGKHCYCQKPLAHDIHEVRVMAKVAAEKKLATQMGTQIHGTDNYRRVVEIIQAGTIGPVSEVVAWCGKAWSGGKRPQGVFDVPKHLHWDLWLGPAPARPYVPRVYHPVEWRGWWDFGNGTLGDMACHLLDLPFWALGLRRPASVEAEGPSADVESAPTGLTVHWEFPATVGKPGVKLTWHDGDKTPAQVAGHRVPDMGVMFVGAKGQMFANYGRYNLYPETEFKDFKAPPQTIPPSIGHWKEWIKACKDGSPTTCNFQYAAALTETVLLGNVAYRAGQRLQWDAQAMKAVNCPEADKFLRRQYRDGWRL
jgi:predicted dehydrogenase